MRLLITMTWFYLTCFGITKNVLQLLLTSNLFSAQYTQNEAKYDEIV